MNYYIVCNRGTSDLNGIPKILTPFEYLRRRGCRRLRGRRRKPGLAQLRHEQCTQNPCPVPVTDS